MKTSSLLNEVTTAYADSTLPWEVAVKIRNLHYRASQGVDPETAHAILVKAIPHGYNNFTASLVKKFPANALITIAREGSVCLYISGAKDVELPSKEQLNADEYDWQADGSLRIWWD